MKRACSKCHILYEETKQQSDCPHSCFPKMCKHDRYNCGNIECNDYLVISNSIPLEEVDIEHINI